MKKIKVDQILEVFTHYTDKLEKKAGATIDMQKIYAQVKDKAIKKEKSFNWFAGRKLAAGLVSLFVVLGLVWFIQIRSGINYLPLAEFKGQIAVEDESGILSLSRGFQIKKSMNIWTGEHSFIVLSKKDKQGLIFIKIGQASTIELKDINLYTDLVLSIEQCELYAEMQSGKEHLIRFNMDDYQLYLKGSRIYIKHDENKTDIVLLEGKLQIKKQDKVLQEVKAGSRIRIIEEKIIIEKVQPADNVYIEDFIGSSKAKEEQGSAKKEDNSIYLGRKNYYSINKEYFTVHDGSQNLYVVKNSSGELFLNLKLPCPSQALPVVYEDHIYVGGRDKNLYMYAIPEKEWLVIKNTGDMLHSGIFIFNKDIYMLNEEGVLSKINPVSRTVKKFMLGIPVRSSGVVEGTKFYIASLDQKLYCFDLQSEKVVWHTDLRDQVIAFQPFIIDEFIILRTVKGIIFGINRNTGKKVWEVYKPKDFFLLYCGRDIYRVQTDGKIEIIDFQQGNITAADYLKTGIKDAAVINKEKMVLVNTENQVLAWDLKNKLLRNLNMNIKAFHAQPGIPFYYIYTLNDKLLKKY